MIELHASYIGKESYNYTRNPNTTKIYYAHLILVNHISLSRTKYRLVHELGLSS